MAQVKFISVVFFLVARSIIFFFFVFLFVCVWGGGGGGGAGEGCCVVGRGQSGVNIYELSLNTVMGEALLSY